MCTVLDTDQSLIDEADIVWTLSVVEAQTSPNPLVDDVVGSLSTG